MDVPIATYEEIKNLAEVPNATYLIDVREAHEIKETGKIPNSINIPLGSIILELTTSENDFKIKFNVPKPTLDSPVIFYCRSGRRSQIAATSATSVGYTNIKNYQGSWLEWAERERIDKNN